MLVNIIKAWNCHILRSADILRYKKYILTFEQSVLPYANGRNINLLRLEKVK